MRWDLGCLPGQYRGTREFPEIGHGGHRADIPLPARGEAAVQIERGPAKSRWHSPLSWNYGTAMALRSAAGRSSSTAPSCRSPCRVLRRGRGVVMFVAILGGWTGVVLCHSDSSSWRIGGRSSPGAAADGGHRTGHGRGRVRRSFIDYELRELCCHLSSSGPDDGFDHALGDRNSRG